MLNSRQSFLSIQIHSINRSYTDIFVKIWRYFFINFHTCFKSDKLWIMRSVSASVFRVKTQVRYVFKLHSILKLIYDLYVNKWSPLYIYISNKRVSINRETVENGVQFHSPFRMLFPMRELTLVHHETPKLKLGVNSDRGVVPIESGIKSWPFVFTDVSEIAGWLLTRHAHVNSGERVEKWKPGSR